MSVIVLGAGVIGVTTAWYLSHRGHEVRVIDRACGPAEGTSLANGGQISVSHPEPWAAPGVLGQVLRSTGRLDAPVRLLPGPDPAMWRWALRFLRHCNGEMRRRNTARIARLALYSLSKLNELRDETEIDFAWGARGTLHVFTDPGALERARPQVDLRRRLGIRQELLDGPGCIEREPVLRASAIPVHGGIFAPDDACGDAARFTRELAGLCEQGGVRFEYGTNVTGLEVSGGRVRAVSTSRGLFEADAVVLALGTGSSAISRRAGLGLPVHPVRGYSLDLPLKPDDPAPRTNLIHETRRLVTSHLGTSLRIAGGADLGMAGQGSPEPGIRARAVLLPAFELFPGLADVRESGRYWAGLRPMTPDGVPLIGGTRLGGLFLNTGHGSLGWTLACGSARLLADLVSEAEPEIDAADYVLAGREIRGN